eukprot:6404845-Amphidinium_carterae.1
MGGRTQTLSVTLLIIVKRFSKAATANCVTANACRVVHSARDAAPSKPALSQLACCSLVSLEISSAATRLLRLLARISPCMGDAAGTWCKSISISAAMTLPAPRLTTLPFAVFLGHGNVMTTCIHEFSRQATQTITTPPKRECKSARGN